MFKLFKKKSVDFSDLREEKNRFKTKIKPQNKEY